MYVRSEPSRRLHPGVVRCRLRAAPKRIWTDTHLFSVQHAAVRHSLESALTYEGRRAWKRQELSVLGLTSNLDIGVLPSRRDRVDVRDLPSYKAIHLLFI